jgi:hypothetical protein
MKLTRGNWIQDTTVLSYDKLPISVKDTFSSFYDSYYNKNDSFYPELISLDQSVDICFVECVTSPLSTTIPHTPGYYFKIGSKKYFFDYRKYNTPIVYYENDLYYFSGKYSSSKERYTFESQSDYKDKLFVKYSLNKSFTRKHKKSQSNCSKSSNIDFVNNIRP